MNTIATGFIFTLRGKNFLRPTHLIIGTTMALALAGPALAGSEGIEITKGKLSSTSLMAHQLLSAKNNRTTVIEGFNVDCAFFRGDDLIGTGVGLKLDVKPGETVYMEVDGIHANGADRTECRVGVVMPLQ
jgi:hypothetical protein